MIGLILKVLVCGLFGLVCGVVGVVNLLRMF